MPTTPHNKSNLQPHAASHEGRVQATPFLVLGLPQLTPARLSPLSGGVPRRARATQLPCPRARLAAIYTAALARLPGRRGQAVLGHPAVPGARADPHVGRPSSAVGHLLRPDTPPPIASHSIRSRRATARARPRSTKTYADSRRHDLHFGGQLGPGHPRLSLSHPARVPLSGWGGSLGLGPPASPAGAHIAFRGLETRPNVAEFGTF
eukprot:scaffold1377_cov390-Prasinococcus_capsulatus_cf.AAC.9